jgi:integrase
MNNSRRDNRGRTLHKGEVQKSSDLTYIYTYTDPFGKRRFVYAPDLVKLREKERQLQRDQLDGLDFYAAGRSSLNDAFDRYMTTKYNLTERTKLGYESTYRRYVQDTFGKKKLIQIRYTDILQFYNYLLTETNISITTLENVHSVLHPTFEMAVRDDIIRKNPSDGVMAEIKKRRGGRQTTRHALTAEQQQILMQYVANHPVFYHWWPMLAILLGTGMRIGECLGLRWCDLDFKERSISVNHALVYYQGENDDTATFKVSMPKTEKGIRTIPMLDMVEEAFEMIKEEQKETGKNKQVIDGMKGFVFMNRFGQVPNPASVNRAIKRIVINYNNDEVLLAKKEKRDPVLLPEISCHIFRHTFATRLCETETNLKVIQSIMGHKNIETTMDIYADATDRKKKESMTALSEKLENLF